MSGLRIVVLGYIVRGPLGGLAWHHLQYVLGLALLGHDVWFVEDSDDYPSCYDPKRSVVDTDPTYGLAFAAAAFERLNLADRWAYHDAHGRGWLGPASTSILNVCASADLLLNLSGVNPLRSWLTSIPARALVDTDPVFTQVRHLVNPVARQTASQHTAFLSFGENLETGRSTIPDDGFPWRTTRQPVVLEAWPVTPGRSDGKYTTVMQWDSYPARDYAGVRYGMKSESFDPYRELPRDSGRVFELALGGTTAPRVSLRQAGWTLRNPLGPTRDPWTYQRYIRRSKAEFSVAKQGYVVSRSGWFSERSAGYLASGRPVLVQETGFSDWLPTGRGVVRFQTPDEALAGVESIDSQYAMHCDAARALAAEYFDSRMVLPALIERAMENSEPEASFQRKYV